MERPPNIPEGFCWCGCLSKTARGKRFVKGHNRKLVHQQMPPKPQKVKRVIPKYCKCGCGTHLNNGHDYEENHDIWEREDREKGLEKQWCMCCGNNLYIHLYKRMSEYSVKRRGGFCRFCANKYRRVLDAKRKYGFSTSILSDEDFEIESESSTSCVQHVDDKVKPMLDTIPLGD